MLQTDRQARCLATNIDNIETDNRIIKRHKGTKCGTECQQDCPFILKSIEHLVTCLEGGKQSGKRHAQQVSRIHSGKAGSTFGTMADKVKSTRPFWEWYIRSLLIKTAQNALRAFEPEPVSIFLCRNFPEVVSTHAIIMKKDNKMQPKTVNQMMKVHYGMLNTPVRKFLNSLEKAIPPILEGETKPQKEKRMDLQEK